MPAVTVNTLVFLSYIGKNQSLGIAVRVRTTPLVAPQLSALACGKSAYIAIPVNASGVCYLAHLIPPSRIVDKDTIHAILQSRTSTNHLRKREVGEVDQWIGVILVPLGVRHLQKDVAALRQASEQTKLSKLFMTYKLN